MVEMLGTVSYLMNVLFHQRTQTKAMKKWWTESGACRRNHTVDTCSRAPHLDAFRNNSTLMFTARQNLNAVILLNVSRRISTPLK
jgi:hypothetical protein